MKATAFECFALALLTACASERSTASPSPVPDSDPETVLHSDPDAYLSFFGVAVAGLPDIDGDGVADLAVGAPRAWSPAGRTGSVVIVSGANWKLIRRIDGAKAGDWFGRHLSCIRSKTGSLLAIAHTGGSSDRRCREDSGISIAGLLGDARQFELRGSTRFLGELGDCDGDGIMDFLCERASQFKLDAAAYSGRDGVLIAGRTIEGAVQLLPVDFNCDGFRDYVVAPKAESLELIVRSGIDGAELFSVPMRRDHGHGSGKFQCTAADVNFDGTPELIVKSADAMNSGGRIELFDGLDHRLLVNVIGDAAENSGDRWIHFQLVNVDSSSKPAGPNLIVAGGPTPLGRLQAYALPSMQWIWQIESAYEENCEISAWNDVDGDAVPEILSGFTYFTPSDTMGNDWPGSVHVISGKTGAIVKLIGESDYPEISFKEYERQAQLRSEERK